MPSVTSQTFPFFFKARGLDMVNPLTTDTLSASPK